MVKVVQSWSDEERKEEHFRLKPGKNKDGGISQQAPNGTNV
jgi:hypothetical protein